MNTRRLAERVAHHLAERLGEEAVAMHHGSLSRKLRLAAEKKLKAGEIQALVATASLELGIDIGAVELVCQVGRRARLGWPGSGLEERDTGMARFRRAEFSRRPGIGWWRAPHWSGRCTKAIWTRLKFPKCRWTCWRSRIVAMSLAEIGREEDCSRWREPIRIGIWDSTEFESIVEMLSEGITARRGRYGDI